MEKVRLGKLNFAVSDLGKIENFTWSTPPQDSLPPQGLLYFSSSPSKLILVPGATSTIKAPLASGKAGRIFQNDMKDNEFERNFNVETRYWWNIGRFKIIESFTNRYIHPLPKTRMVDLGCGTGATTLWLQKFGKVKGVDGSPKALSYCKKRGLRDLTLSKMEHLKLPSGHFDAAFALDILEHVSNDQKAIREIYRVLKPGAKLLVTSPAYQWLWSEHDEVCNHKRRYTLFGIVSKLQVEGFKIRRQSYCIVFPFFPLLLLLRFRSWFKKDKKIMMSVVPLPKPINDLLIFLLALENFLMRFIDFPFGVSVICLAEKPNEPPQ